MATNQQIPALSPRLDLYGNRFRSQLGILQINNKKILIRQSMISHSALLLLLFKRVEARDKYQSPPKALRASKKNFDTEQVLQQGSSFTENEPGRYQTDAKENNGSGMKQLRFFNNRPIDEDNQLEKEEEKDKISELDGIQSLDIDRERINRFMSLANRLRAAGGQSKQQRSRSNSSRGSSQKASMKTDGVQVIDDFESDDDEDTMKKNNSLKNPQMLQLMSPYVSATSPIKLGTKAEEEQGSSNQNNVIDMLSEIEEKDSNKKLFKLNNDQRINKYIIEDTNSDQQSQNSQSFNAIKAKHQTDKINKDINANERRAMNNRRQLVSPMEEALTAQKVKDLKLRNNPISETPEHNQSSRGHNTERKLRESPSNQEGELSKFVKQSSENKA